MKSQRTFILIFFILCSAFSTSIAQTLDQVMENNYYRKEINKSREPIPYQFIRESDIVWSDLIWRTIDLHEKFNQFFFYPTEPEGIEGRINFTYLLWNAAQNEQIPMYEDDELKIPIDPTLYFIKYTVGDTIQLEIYDDESNEEFHYETAIVPRIFYSEDVKQYRLKEVWYIEKNTSRQNSRSISLAMIKDNYRIIAGEEEYIGSYPLFWIPMQSMLVRRLFVQHEAYYEDNIASLPTWDQIFNTQNYTSFIIRESNRFNRYISDYLTGEDALIEADRIEEKLLSIGLDMWEY